MKAILIAVGLGALTGVAAAVKVDVELFRKWLTEQGFRGFWANLKRWDWSVAIPRYLDGAIGGAAAAFFVAVGWQGVGA